MSKKNARYRLSPVPIARGGQAAVFRAEDRETGEAVAFKRLLRRDEESIARLRREIEVQAALSHPAVMPVIQHGPNFDWYTMPLAERSLADLRVPLDAGSLVPIVVTIIGALEAAQLRGFIHRDVTPANIMELASPTARWVLADWGLVRKRGGTSVARTAKGAQFGTAGFSSPESWLDAHSVDHRGDIYGLGRTIIWASTGIVPTPNTDLSAPEPWSSLAASACQVPVGDRPQSYDELRSLLPRNSTDALGPIFVAPESKDSTKVARIDKRLATELSGDLLAAADRTYLASMSLRRARATASEAGKVVASKLEHDLDVHGAEVNRLLQQINLSTDNEFRLAAGEVAGHSLAWRIATIHPNGDQLLQDSRRIFELRVAPRLRRFVQNL
ncbi:MAG: serine/threonine-protein kinase [Thermoanaerobaculia bacterium]